MSVKYKLQKNKLTEQTDLYAAHITASGSVDIEKIADRILAGGSTLTRPDVIATLESFTSAIDAMITEGKRVRLGGICEIGLKIKGRFNGADDMFDTQRHTLDVAIWPGARLRRLIKDTVTLSKQEATVPSPLLSQFYDTASGLVNEFATVGNIAKIAGSRLAFDMDREDEGVFFVAEDGSTEVRADSVATNKPSQIVLLVPQLPPEVDSWQVQVRTRFTANGQLRMAALDSMIHTQPVFV